MKRSLAGILSLLIPALSWADLTNTAQASYRDALGTPHITTSNTVTVVVSNNTPPATAPTVDLLRVPRVIPVDGTITIVATNASVIHWTMTRQATSSQVFAAALDLPSAAPTSSVSTPSPALSLATLALTPGDYTLVVTAETSSRTQSAPAQPDV